MCYEKAGDICGTRGYDVIAGGSDQGVVMAGNQYGLYGGSVMNRRMLIKCKNLTLVLPQDAQLVVRADTVKLRRIFCNVPRFRSTRSKTTEAPSDYRCALE